MQPVNVATLSFSCGASDVLRVDIFLSYNQFYPPPGLTDILEDLRLFCEFGNVKLVKKDAPLEAPSPDTDKGPDRATPSDTGAHGDENDDNDTEFLRYTFTLTPVSVHWAVTQENVPLAKIQSWFSDLNSDQRVAAQVVKILRASEHTPKNELFLIRSYQTAQPHVDYRLITPAGSTPRSLSLDRLARVDANDLAGGMRPVLPSATELDESDNEDEANKSSDIETDAITEDLHPVCKEADARRWKIKAARRAQMFFVDAVVLDPTLAVEQMEFCQANSTSKRPHFYQQEACDRVLVKTRIDDNLATVARSGILIAPCGSGKTLIGVMAMCKIQRPTVIFCATQMAVNHWRAEVLAHTQLSADRHVFCMTSTNNRNRSPDKWTNSEIMATRAGRKFGDSLLGAQVTAATASAVQDAAAWDSDPLVSRFRGPVVIISTYTMFATTFTGADGAEDETEGVEAPVQLRSKSTMAWMDHCRNREWGLLIFDEVHQVPAETFSRVATGFKSHVKLGLTATLVREDDKVMQLKYLVGPVLYELDTPLLQQLGHVARVKCVQVECAPVPSLPENFERTLVPADLRSVGSSSISRPQREVEKVAAILNPDKVRVCAVIVARHVARGDKCIVYCDTLSTLQAYKDMMGCPMIQGNTLHSERERIIQEFRACRGGASILFSSVGDQSIDIPQANVAIQVSVPDGSRMQELQRVGRVQRVSRNKRVAWFYSLVTRESDEEAYATRRRAYLHQHGYNTEHVSSNAFEHAEVDAVFSNRTLQHTMEFWKTVYYYIRPEFLEQDSPNQESKTRGKNSKRRKRSLAEAETTSSTNLPELAATEAAPGSLVKRVKHESYQENNLDSAQSARKVTPWVRKLIQEANRK